jgi:hypothetical protein
MCFQYLILFSKTLIAVLESLKLLLVCFWHFWNLLGCSELLQTLL